MSKAAELLKMVPAKKEKVNGGRVVMDDRAMVDVPSFGRSAEVRAIARLFRIVKAKQRALDAELDMLKVAIRDAGQQLLDSNAAEGKYYSQADVGGVKVSRANKLSPVPFRRDDMVEAVGATEYSVFFKESAVKKFESINAMRQYDAVCELAGVEVEGVNSEVVTGTPKLAEHIVRVRDTMAPEQVELLEVCVKDQALRVGGR